MRQLLATVHPGVMQKLRVVCLKENASVKLLDALLTLGRMLRACYNVRDSREHKHEPTKPRNVRNRPHHK